MYCPTAIEGPRKYTRFNLIKLGLKHIIEKVKGFYVVETVTRMFKTKGRDRDRVFFEELPVFRTVSLSFY